MSQQVSLNQLLKKTEHYDKVCGIFDTAVADLGGGTTGGAAPGGEEASASAGCGGDGDRPSAFIYYPFNCMFSVT